MVTPPGTSFSPSPGDPNVPPLSDGLLHGTDRSAVIIWLTDATGACTFLNRAWSAFIGEPAENDLGDRWSLRLHPHDVDDYLAGLRRAVAERQPLALKGRFRRHSGDFRCLHVAGLPLYGRDGGYAGHAGAALDITDFPQREHFQLTTPELQLLVRVADEVANLTTDLRRSEARLRTLSAHAEHVRETERRELARALHDDLGQLFTSMRLEVAAAIHEYQRAPAAGSRELVDRLQSAAGLLEIGLANVRQLATTLRPPILDHLGLIEGIRWEAGTFAQRTGIRCRVAARPRVIEMDHRSVTTLYRILLEALTNVARHAHAGAVWVFVRVSRGRAFLHVRDNGRGITAEQAADPRAMGLLGMRERAFAVGGDFQVTPAPGGGTRVLASVPLHPHTGMDA